MQELQHTGVNADGRTLFDDDCWTRIGTTLGLSARELELVRHIFAGEKLYTIASKMGKAIVTPRPFRKVRLCR